MGLVATIFAGVLVVILSDELKAWLPKIQSLLLALALHCSPSSLRERFAEEWAAHLEEVPGELTRVVVAAGFVRAGCGLKLRESGACNVMSWRLTNSLAAAALLVLIIPVFTMTAFLLSLEGPVFEKTNHIGKGGRSITLYRLRTRNPRLPGETTKVGLFVERYKFVGLPFLFGVIRGDLTLVGPSPRTPKALERLGTCAELYLKSRPGMFSPADVCGGNEDAAEAEYLMERSLVGDLKLLCQVLVSMLFVAPID